MDTKFFDLVSAWRKVTGPSALPSLLPGFQLPMSLKGASFTKVSGITPFSRAAAYKNGLKLEPGCRQPCVAWLNWLRPKSKPPTKARKSPLRGSKATNAPSAWGHWVMCHCLPCSTTRTTAPRLSLCAAGTLSVKPACAWRRPAPSMPNTSPEASTTVTFLLLISVTMAGRKSSSSSTSLKVWAMAGSSFFQASGRVSRLSGPRHGWRISWAINWVRRARWAACCSAAIRVVVTWMPWV